MSCRGYLPLINDLADGTLNGKNKKRVKGHLSDCKDCSGQFKETKELKSLLKKFNSTKPQKEYFTEVTKQILASIAARINVSRKIN